MNRFIEHSQYHKFLRISALVVTAVLLFQSGIISQTTKNLTNNTGHYLANAVGMYASVAPNEVNTLTAEITRLEGVLEETESELAKAREIEVNLSQQTNPTEDTTYALSAILFIILVLIVLNYALDFVRARKVESLEIS